MLLFDKNHNQLNVGDVKAKFQNLDSVPTPSIEDVNTALGEYYNQALQLESSKYQFKAEFAATPALNFFPGIGGNILAAIKKFICGILDSSSTKDEILDTVLSALASIIPGGIFIESIAKIVVKFILSTGISSFCDTTANS